MLWPDSQKTFMFTWTIIFKTTVFAHAHVSYSVYDHVTIAYHNSMHNIHVRCNTKLITLLQKRIYHFVRQEAEQSKILFHDHYELALTYSCLMILYYSATSWRSHLNNIAENRGWALEQKACTTYVCWHQCSENESSRVQGSRSKKVDILGFQSMFKRKIYIGARYEICYWVVPVLVFYSAPLQDRSNNKIHLNVKIIWTKEIVWKTLIRMATVGSF